MAHSARFAEVFTLTILGMLLVIRWPSSQNPPHREVECASEYRREDGGDEGQHQEDLEDIVGQPGKKGSYFLGEQTSEMREIEGEGYQEPGRGNDEQNGVRHLHRPHHISSSQYQLQQGWNGAEKKAAVEEQRFQRAKLRGEETGSAHLIFIEEKSYQDDDNYRNNLANSLSGTHCIPFRLPFGAARQPTPIDFLSAHKPSKANTIHAYNVEVPIG